MRKFSLLIKPASADCNLRCRYCFYIDHLKDVKKTPRMSDEVLEALISSYMKTDQEKHYVFGWQGGEPTLMGYNFYKRVVELQETHAPPNSMISNGIQTNGTLITEKLANLFSEYKFLLGVSLDGPPKFHDIYRRTVSGHSTHSLVMRGINILRKYGVEFNILILVNNENVHHAKEIYDYLKNQGFFYHQYIPCVEFDENNQLLPYSINGEEWGNFLCDLFDEWIITDIHKVSIRLFDSIIEYLVNGNLNVCYMDKDCRQYFVVEYDGNVYPCDFFVRKDLLLGNILNDTWKELLNSPIYKNFGKQKANWNKECYHCSYLNLCHGDCQKFRPGQDRNPNSLSILCKGWKKFFTHALSRFKIIAREIQKGNTKITKEILKVKKIGRNDPCPCGSGKKYKNCCLR
ncbi:MAG: anaerobic sulfatase maturase [Promethearchaeota archaeon]